MSEEWHADGFDARLHDEPRIVMLYYAEWCPFSRAFLPHFEEAEPETSVKMARANLHHPLDPRWDDHAIASIPTVIYHEHGEELERVEAPRGKHLTPRAFHQFLEDVEALQERYRLRHGRMQVDKTG